MTLEPTQALLESLYWITLSAVIVSSASAVLKAGLKHFDLFGVFMIAVVTGLGGGSLRDMLLDREVFWIRDQMFFFASLASAQQQKLPTVASELEKAASKQHVHARQATYRGHPGRWPCGAGQR